MVRRCEWNRRSDFHCGDGVDLSKPAELSALIVAEPSWLRMSAAEQLVFCGEAVSEEAKGSWQNVKFTVDGKTLTAPAGTLLIEACKSAGIEIPAFCYYPGLSLQAACRMCVVRIDKMPKMQTACTTPVAEGMVVFTETDEIKQARKATLELLLGNHPLDCPVCDAGGECELQDMTFKYGAADSFYAEPKNHREEQKWSPVVYFDRPRCILCYRCIRMCGEGMDVFALGIQNRGSSSVIAPNVPVSESPDHLAHLDCEECGMCIDACPVGALTSGTYRYKTRPWEMNHVATICTHCGDGCKTTLGVRATGDGAEIIRGDNRDRSGINNDFLCNKGRYAFDFANHEGRLTQPLDPRRQRRAAAGDVGGCARSRRRALPRDPRCAAAARPSASSGRTASPTKRPTCCRSSRAACWARTTSIITGRRIMRGWFARLPGRRIRRLPCAMRRRILRCWLSAATRRSRIRRSPGHSAPTSG